VIAKHVKQRDQQKCFSVSSYPMLSLSRESDRPDSGTVTFAPKHCSFGRNARNLTLHILRTFHIVLRQTL